MKLEFTGRCKLPDVKTELGSSARGPDALFFFWPHKLIFSHIEGEKEEIKDQMVERMGRKGGIKKRKRTLVLKYFKIPFTFLCVSSYPCSTREIL